MFLLSGDPNNEQHKKKSSALSHTPQYLSNQIPQGNLNLRLTHCKLEWVPSSTNKTPQPNKQMAQTNLDHGNQWDFTPRNLQPLSKITPSMTANSWQSCTVFDAGCTFSKAQKSLFWSIQTMQTYDTIRTLGKLAPGWPATCQKGSNTISYWNTNLVLQIMPTPYHGDLTMKGQILTTRIS